MASPTVDYLLGIPLLHKHAVTDITGLGPFLQGGILFGGASGDIAQSLLGLYWDSATDRFSVGTNSNYTSKSNILTGDTTERGEVIRLTSGQSANATEIQNSTGSILNGVMADGSYLIPTTNVVNSTQRMSFKGTPGGFSNYALVVDRNQGQNNAGNWVGFYLRDNGVEVSMRCVTNGFTQGVVDLELHNQNGKCYSAPSGGGNFYFNPVQNTTDISINRVPAQTMYPGAGSPSPQGLQRVSICPIAATSPTSVEDIASRWVEGAPTQSVNMTITRRIADLIHTGDAGGYGQIIRGYTSQTQNLSEWQDVSKNNLASVSAAGNFKCQGFGAKVASKTSTYTAADENVILCDASSGAFTINLPAAASFTDRQYVIKKTDSSANAITIDGNSSETIDGATTQALTVQYQSITIACNGSNWFII